MPHTTRTRYAVVSCHVERPLDDAAWTRFEALQRARPGGFPVAALVRPADRAAGEDEALVLARSREAAARAPLGHHTHWTAPDHARPPAPPSDARPPAPPSEDREAQVTQCHKAPGARVLGEGRRLREAGLVPSLFCGGGWYTDVAVAEACVELGYVDCTPRRARPRYLAPGERWAELAAPARIVLPSGARLPAIPTTHSLGDLARGLLHPWSLPAVVHVYFHDTDLLSRRRRWLLRTLLPVLARFRRPSDLGALARAFGPEAPEIPWDDVARL